MDDKNKAKMAPPMRFITRMHDSMWRVWVTFGEIDCGQVYFSDANYGGKEFALEESEIYRNSLVEKHGIPLRIFDGNGFHVQGTRCTSGVIGVSLAVHNRAGRVNLYWIARRSIDGEQRNISRSIRIYGYVGAWNLVLAARNEHTGLALLDGPPEPDEWVRRWLVENGVDF